MNRVYREGNRLTVPLAKRAFQAACFSGFCSAVFVPLRVGVFGSPSTKAFAGVLPC